MGTNYYLKQKDPCPACGHVAEPLHIGKSSAGWVFALRVVPDRGIDSLDDWKRLWTAPGAVIEDEYGRRVTPETMLTTITQRQWARSHSSPAEVAQRPYGIIEGPNGLLREIESDRVRHAPDGATYDIIAGDFW